MWSQLQLCLFVGLAFASNTPAWKENTQYKYRINSRTLTSLHDVSDQYTGVLIRGDLLVKPKQDDVLQLEIPQLEYAQFHSNLPQGWRQQIADNELSYKSLPISRQPFEVVMKNGVVRDLIVNRDLSNWEANLIKAIVSQIQLDTNAENLIDDKINTLAQYKQNSAVYKTMEDTVTGISETQYDIHPLPEHIVQSKPWLAPHANLKGDGEVVEIVKNKNHSRSEQRPAYHYGFADVEPDFEPGKNQMGEFLTRTSVGRAVITGRLDRYTIQNTYTVEEILVNPTADNDNQGSVRSILNLTLASIQARNEKPKDLSNTISLGNLVYRFNNPFDQSNKVRPGEQHQLNNENQGILNDFNSEYEQNQSKLRQQFRQQRQQFQRHNDQSNEDSQDNSIDSDEYWQQEESELNKAPASPLLPFTTGFQGQSIKKKHNIVQTVEKLSLQIAQDFQHPDSLPKENTMGKYVTLVSLVRVMDEKEMQEAAQRLYKKEPSQSQQQQGQQQGQQKERHAWMIYRDAVAQAGTGPALLTIQDWIQKQNVQNGEAADIVYVAAQSARQPTDKYMQSFFEMMKSQEIMQRSQLNASVILSFAQLVHQVYVNEEESHGNFPVHSFGEFRASRGIQFLKNQVVPYLTKELHQAISKADANKVHTYIRALGDIGHPQMLAAFEPYLEGKKQASQFQRFLMVVALDKLTQAYPSVAQRVLYRIYQNTNEQDQVRTAAVYQLMKTDPTPDLLQRMAEYTNMDSSEQVNAAVKSSIESAANLEGEEYASLRSAAQSATGLLTNKYYGAQYSMNLLNNYVAEELDSSFKQSVQTFGAEDSLMPEGLRYTLRERVGGVGQQLIAMRAMVSSIEDLTNVFQKITKGYQQQQSQKQRVQQQQQHKLTSENIARLLNIEIENNEQLEGYLHIKLPHLEKILSFDNHTIEKLPQLLQEIETVMNKGKEFHESKIVNGQELAVAFPTQNGWPFIYTYDEPLAYRFEGRVKAKATPQVSSNKALNKPDKVEVELEIRSLVSGKSQTQFGFITPFDAQRYSAGYDKNVQVHVPAKVSMHLDVKENQIKIDIEPLEPNQPKQLVHYSTWPYTTKENIFAAERQNRQIMRKSKPEEINLEFGKKSTGIAFKLQVINDDMRQLDTLFGKTHKRTMIENLQNWDSNRIQYSEFNVQVDHQQSTTRKASVHFGYKNQRGNENNNESPKTTNIDQYHQNMPEDSKQRQQELLNSVSADIPSASAYAFDASINFAGDKTIKYTATGAFAKSNANPKSRFALFMRRSGSQDNSPYYIVMSGKNHAPNTNALDMDYAIKFDPTSTSNIEIAFGENPQNSNKFEVEMKARQSEERKRYLKQDPMYHECQNQQKQGNHALRACANMTLRANFLDRFDINIKVNQMKSNIRYEAEKWYSSFRHMASSYIEENSNNQQEENQQQQKSDELEIKGQFSPNLKSLTFAIETNNGQVLIKNIPMNPWARRVLVPHPVFHMKSRLVGQLFGHHMYRPVCVVDKTAANTFNKQSYPVKLSPEWNTMMLYIPSRAQQERQQSENDAVSQLQKQIENYAVLVRSDAQNPSEKEVKITVATPETEQEHVEITLKPTPSGQQPKVIVNEKEIKYSAGQSTNLYKNLVEIYALPNNEVKVELSNAFYVIYDGARVKLALTSAGKFQNSVRGICGSFSIDKATSLENPQGCIVRKPEELIAEYRVSNQPQQVNRQSRGRAQDNQCHQKEVKYVDVITDRDVQKHQQNEPAVNICTKHQTRYITVGDQLCFTLRPIPVCKDNCKLKGVVSKNVPVHCVKQSNAAELWKKQIDKGASPDFSLKPETSQVRMQIPQTCSA